MADIRLPASVRSAELVNRSARALIAQTAFAGTIAFYGLVALPLARREIAYWHRRAHAIGDPSLRGLALATLEGEHLNSEGAAAFAALHPPAARRLVPLLVAYQLAWDFVDTLLERPALATGNRDEICGALWRAVAPNSECAGGRVGAGSSGGFLGELVDACRAGCARLPRYSEAEPALRRVAARSDALLVTNGAPEGPIEALRVWAASHPEEGDELEPAELCAAAHCSLGVHALLATAANPESRPDDFEAIDAAYFPWIDALCTLLDSFVDLQDDTRTGDFSFVAQYSSAAHATQRVGAIADRALKATRRLPAADRHAALMCALVGMYVSAPAAQTQQVRPVADAVLDATRPLSRQAQRVLAFRRGLTAKTDAGTPAGPASPKSSSQPPRGAR